MSEILDSYDPNGEELWDYHVGIAHEAMTEIQRLEGAGEPVPKELYWLWEEHNQAWPKAELSRHRTIQDYVRFHWAFLFAKAEKEGVSFPMPAFDDGATIEDVAALYRHYEEKIDRAIRAKHDKLPEGRPDGLDIFEPGEGRLVISELRRFEQRLLGVEVVTLVSYDLRPTESHICLALVPDEICGTCAMVRFEDIINCLYREALVQAYQVLEDRFWLEVLGVKLIEVFKAGVRALKYPLIGLVPNKMRFYLHIPAELSHWHEPAAEFKHVPLVYDAPTISDFGHFRDGSFENLDRVPSYIKHARYIEGLTTPSPHSRGAFYRRAMMSLDGTTA